jgi:hypothetical protein
MKQAVTQRQQDSPPAGWDAMPERWFERGLSEGQPLSIPRYRLLHLLSGVALPVAAIGTEWTVGWSARAYVNPVPNGWLLALALSAPLANLMLWFRCCAVPSPRWLVRCDTVIVPAANLLALLVSFGYSLLYVPVIPTAVILSVVAIGLLPLAPFFTFHTAWRLRQSYRRRRTLIPFLVGIPALSAARRVFCQTTE